MTELHMHRDGAIDITTEVSTRLLAGIDAMPKRQRWRFRPAARRAADALELAAPALLGMSEGGLLAGLYSTVTLGHLAVAIADADDCLMFTPSLRVIPGAVADGEAVFGDISDRMSCLLTVLLEDREMTLPQLGVLLRQQEHRQQIGLLAANGVTPAFVALLSSHRMGAVRVVLPHGRTWPALELKSEAGSA